MPGKVAEDILQGAREALAYVRGELKGAKVHRVEIPETDVAALRRRLGLTQREFAAGFGVPLGTLRHWEQGLRRPEGPARVLLAVIRKDPNHVIKAIWPGKGKKAA